MIGLRSALPIHQTISPSHTQPLLRWPDDHAFALFPHRCSGRRRLGHGAGAGRHRRRDARRFCGRAKTMSWRSIARTGENKRFLPGVTLPKILRVTGASGRSRQRRCVAAGGAGAGAGAVSRARWRRLIAPGTPLVICAKGIEKDTGRLVNEVLAKPRRGRRPRSCPGRPSPAMWRKGLPTAVTIAARGDIAARLQASLSSPAFRPYASDDVTGVALGGAAKNVYAIACGVVEGLGLGENARAALLARSFAELARLGEALGAQARNLDGPVGAGRSGADRHQQKLAQFFLRRRTGPGQERWPSWMRPAIPWRKAWRPRRRW